MPEDNQPLLLMVSEQEPGLFSTRTLLREAGFLVASGRTVEAAISLLAQVRVDGCVLHGHVQEGDAIRLAETLDRYSPGCPKMYLSQSESDLPPGWRRCAADTLVQALKDAFLMP